VALALSTLYRTHHSPHLAFIKLFYTTTQLLYRVQHDLMKVRYYFGFDPIGIDALFYGKKDLVGVL
jgi:hypothetical protein